MHIPLKFETRTVTLEDGEVVTGIATNESWSGGRFGHGGGLITAEHDDDQVTKSIMSTVQVKHEVVDGNWRIALTPQIPLRIWLLGEKDEPLRSPTFHYNPLVGFNFGISPDHYEDYVCDEVYSRHVTDHRMDSVYDIQLYTTATLDVLPDPKSRGSWHAAVGLILSNEQQGGAIIGLQDMDPSAKPESGNWFNVPDGTRVILLGVIIGYPCDEHGAHHRWVPWAEWADVMPGPDGKRPRRRGLADLLSVLASARPGANPLEDDIAPAKVDPSKVH